jgi:hypothetical protein
MGSLSHRIFPAGVAGTWVAMMPCEDGQRGRRSPRRSMGHPFGIGRPLVSWSRLRPSTFYRPSRALSKETRASSLVRLRLSSARRSSVCAPLTEGEHTDTVASRWRRDDRGLNLVEVECVMPSSRSTSSCHCFMAPGDAVELGGGVATLWPQTAL